MPAHPEHTALLRPSIVFFLDLCARRHLPTVHPLISSALPHPPFFFPVPLPIALAPPLAVSFRLPPADEDIWAPREAETDGAGLVGYTPTGSPLRACVCYLLV